MQVGTSLTVLHHRPTDWTVQRCWDKGAVKGIALMIGSKYTWACTLLLMSTPSPALHPIPAVSRYFCVEEFWLWWWKLMVTSVSFTYGFYRKSCWEKRGVLSLLSLFWFQVTEANSGQLKQKWTFNRRLEYFMGSRNWKSKSLKITGPQVHYRPVKGMNSRLEPL